MEATMRIPHRRFPFVLLILCSIAWLQFPPAARALGPKGDAFLGFGRTGTDTFYPNVGGLNGWEGALHVKVKPLVGIEGDVAHYGLGASSTVPRTTTFMAGPRVTVGALGIKVFAHALAGGEHSANSSGLSISGGALTYALGGGVDVRIAPFFAWRVAGDYLSAPTQSPATGTRARVSTGLVFRF
jgi:hypothetical protein